MTLTDDEIRDAFAPLRAAEPTEAEVAAVLAAAAAPPRRRRRALRPAIAVAGVAALAAAALALLPTGSEHNRPLTALGLLRTTAAVAADQPGPPAWAGFRYVKSRNLWTSSAFEPSAPGGGVPKPVGEPYTFEQIEEAWVDRDWHGRQLVAAGRLVSGTVPPEGSALAKARDVRAPGDQPNLYGDGPLTNVPLDQLPTDPQALYDLLVAAYKDLRWSPGNGKWAQGHPTADQVRYDVLRSVLLLLTEANTTPSQRAALIEVLGQYPGVRPLESVRDHIGREGRGVEIPASDLNGRPEAPVRVIFAPDTSELLEWSQGGVNPGQVHTFLAFGHVRATGDRP